MSDEPTPCPDVEEAPGWVVYDPDGNVVDTGTVVQLEAVGNPVEEQEQQ